MKESGKKIIYNQDIYHSSKIINEDSNSLTFNYQNQYSDNRFFGTDNRDNTSRFVYGIETDFQIKKYEFESLLAIASLSSASKPFSLKWPDVP